MSGSSQQSWIPSYHLCVHTQTHTHPNRFISSLQIFGFCRADLFYDVEASDLETPKNIVTNCEVFNLKVRCFSSLCHDQCQTRWCFHTHSIYCSYGCWCVLCVCVRERQTETEEGERDGGWGSRDDKEEKHRENRESTIVTVQIADMTQKIWIFFPPRIEKGKVCRKSKIMINSTNL